MDIPDWMFGKIPEYMRKGAMLYVRHGIEPGGFMTAVLENNFYEAISRMDENNWRSLKEYRDFLSYLPCECWGNPEKVRAWMKHRGMEGLEDAQD